MLLHLKLGNSACRLFDPALAVVTDDKMPGTCVVATNVTAVRSLGCNESEGFLFPAIKSGETTEKGHGYIHGPPK